MGIGTLFKKGGSKLMAGAKMGAKEAFRASLYSNLVGGDEEKTISQRIGGAIGDSAREATFGQMGALGKAITGGSSKSKSGKSPTSGGGVQGTTPKSTPIKTDNVITAISQSTNQIVGAIGTLNATQRMGFNAQTNQIQAQAQALETLSGYGEDTVIALREIAEILNKQSYDNNNRASSSVNTMPSYRGGAEPPQAANDNGGGLVGDGIMGALAGGALAAGGAVLSGGKKLVSKGAEKILGKAGEKTLAKTVLKKLPGIGLLAGVAFGIDRLMDGDIVGAGGELLSGALSTIPGLGTAGSLAIDAGLAARDMGAFGDASPANAEPVTGGNNETELSSQEINQLFQAAPVGMSDEGLLALAQKMFPGRKYGTLKAHIKKLHDMMGQSDVTSNNVQLASNEILPGMLGGSGAYLSERQQQMDTARQGGDIPTLSGSFGTSEGSLRQEEQRLEESVKKEQTPNKIEFTARELIYKADEVTFDVDNLTFIYRKKEEKEESAPGGGNNQAGPPSPVTPGGTGPSAGPNGPNSGPSSAGGGGGASGGAPGTITGIQETGKGFNVVQLADGSVEKRTGDRNWRNNNPGNLEYGDFAKKHGAIGTDGRFAIFPTFEAGEKAQEALLFEGKGYQGMTIAQAISRYAPPSENNTGNYISTVASAAGVSPDTPLANLTPEQRKAMIKAMHKVEGLRAGKVEVLKKGSGNTSTAGATPASSSSSSASVPSIPSNSPLMGASLGGASAGMSLESQNTSLQNSANQALRNQNQRVADRISGRSSGDEDAPLPPGYQNSSGTTGTGQDLAGLAGSASGPIAVAQKMLGMNENRDYQQLQNFLNQYSGTPPLTINSDSGPWCAKFVNGVLGSQGIPGTGSNMAKSFLNYGGAVYDKASGQGDPKQAQPGDIAVFNRAGGGSGSGHVAFVESVSGDSINVIGGNQSDGQGGGVTRRPRKMSEVVSIRRPGASGQVAQNAQIPTAGAGGGGGGAPTNMSSGSGGGGGMGGFAGMGGGNPLSAMLGGGGSPFSMIGNMLGGIVGNLSQSTSLASAAGPAPSTNINMESNPRLADNTRRDMPGARNPAPGMDETLAGLIKHAFG